MNKTAIGLKIIAIIVNVILILLAIPASIINHCAGVWLMMVVFVVFTAVINIVTLSFARQLLTEICGIILICLASVLNGCSLIAVVVAISLNGMPLDPISNLAVIVLLTFPLITLSALFVKRAQLNKEMR